MFFFITMERTLLLEPRFFGPEVHETLRARLREEVEGTISGRYGFVVSVTDVEEIGKGKCPDASLSNNGAVEFPIRFKAIVMRPFRNEVVDAVVTSVFKMGIMAEAGPIQIFVTTQLIPDDMHHDEHAGCFVTDDESVKISKGDEIRIKIVGVRVDAREISCVGSIADEFLGKAEG